MSDFDKEAEREKLREKYERDAKEREATQRMSDLLLKGATMTNAHCGTCGDPLFQQNGTTFCPSCHGNPDAVEGTDLEAQPANESDLEAQPANESDLDADDASDTVADSSERQSRRTESTPSNATGQPDATATERSGSSGNKGASSNAAERPTQNAVEQTPSKEPNQPSSSAAESTPNRSVAPEQPSTPDQRSPRHNETQSAPAVDGDREAARASLVRALEKFAAKAAETDDPRHATACLEAAREASEALETLR